ncbi:MbtH family NRPS accessory protein [Paenibacillus urinalis]|uniref:MbtH family NRPS accessory protein n=1 Tax=Paenibacillus urinalis TaxID=521520 RepID=A0ABY7XF45_9BACL|nr:MbtH family NRPS accessory protein [Paenibacillus urinalis]WDH96188.1 MbtH family NRPS accessory protein [Paenibacillus urinalis]WDI04411.1 MbtH family NRPS accessory protein [Paenibacillus urinalis]
MANPFDNENSSFVVLINDEEQYSMWPEMIDVPPGWTIVYGTDNKLACQNYIEVHWTDMRPKSLR